MYNVFFHIEQIVEVCTQYLSYDPNYNYDDDEDGEEMEVDEEDDDDVEDDYRYASQGFSSKLWRVSFYLNKHLINLS